MQDRPQGPVAQNGLSETGVPHGRVLGLLFSQLVDLRQLRLLLANGYIQQTQSRPLLFNRNNVCIPHNFWIADYSEVGVAKQPSRQ
jgi:hypothetical protein